MTLMEKIFGCSPKARKLDVDEHEDSSDETTPTTTVSECTDVASEDDVESWDRVGATAEAEEEKEEDAAVVPQLGPGLFPSDYDDCEACEERSTRPSEAKRAPALAPVAASSCREACAVERDSEPDAGAAFTMQETLFVFDWDDTILPSSWIRRQGLRLDSGSVVQAWQQDRLAEVASAAAETLRLAKQHGTVVLLTNAERGWIELSCEKFLPTLLPMIESIKTISARTTYETPYCTSPLDWKVLAFEAEIARACGAETLVDPMKRKNIHSLGDSVHEREALLRATATLPNCYPKSLKFADRPDINQLLQQHSLVSGSFEQVVQHNGNLDLSINCS